MFWWFLTFINFEGYSARLVVFFWCIFWRLGVMFVGLELKGWYSYSFGWILIWYDFLVDYGI